MKIMIKCSTYYALDPWYYNEYIHGFNDTKEQAGESSDDNVRQPFLPVSGRVDYLHVIPEQKSPCRNAQYMTYRYGKIDTIRPARYRHSVIHAGREELQAYSGRNKNQAGNIFRVRKKLSAFYKHRPVKTAQRLSSFLR